MQRPSQFPLPKRRSRRPSRWPMPLGSRSIGPTAQDSRGPVYAGIAFTVLFHLGLAAILYSYLKLPKLSPKPKEAVVLELVRMPNAHHGIFIETNPAAPDEAPTEHTPFFSSQNQRAAQEEPLEDGHSLLPTELSSVGHFAKIVQGDVDLLKMPKESVDLPEAGSRSKSKTTSEDGVAEIAQKITSRPPPQPRPQAVVPLTEGRINSQRSGTSRSGLKAVDARFTQYGSYIQRMNEATNAQFQLLCRASKKICPDSKAFVAISYSINSRGEVIQLTLDYTNASNVIIDVCKDAILSRAPFGPWTTEMIKTLGDEPQRFTIFFEYL